MKWLLLLLLVFSDAMISSSPTRSENMESKSPTTGTHKPTNAPTQAPTCAPASLLKMYISKCLNLTR